MSDNRPLRPIDITSTSPTSEIVGRAALSGDPAFAELTRLHPNAIDVEIRKLMATVGDNKSALVDKDHPEHKATTARLAQLYWLQEHPQGKK